MALWGYHRSFGIAGTQARPFGIRSVEDEYAGREWRGLRFVVVFEPSFDESDLVSFHAVVMKIAGVSAAGDKDDNDGFLIGSGTPSFFMAFLEPSSRFRVWWINEDGEPPPVL